MCAFADRKRATTELKRSIEDIVFSVELICSFFHDMHMYFPVSQNENRWILSIWIPNHGRWRSCINILQLKFCISFKTVAWRFWKEPGAVMKSIRRIGSCETWYNCSTIWWNCKISKNKIYIVCYKTLILNQIQFQFQS